MRSRPRRRTARAAVGDGRAPHGPAPTTPVQYLEDGDSFVVVASNGGAAHPPAWYLNRRADPHARVERRDLSPRVASARTCSWGSTSPSGASVSSFDAPAAEANAAAYGGSAR
jgi:deazaflavin-dependent oxidoreductase (nitroreductase family)